MVDACAKGSSLISSDTGIDVYQCRVNAERHALKRPSDSKSPGSLVFNQNHQPKEMF
jgi:hypothetical protein